MRNRRALSMWLGVGAVVAAGALGFAVWLWRVVSPPEAGPARTVIVHRGDTAEQVSVSLCRAGLIRHAFVFRWYAKMKGSSHHLQAGMYAFTKGDSVGSITDAIQSGRQAVQDVVLTIPEGFSVRQIADRLEQAGVCTQSSFLAAVTHASVKSVAGEPLQPSTGVPFALEGYLFPDTYRFSKPESATDVVAAMTHNFEVHVRPQLQDLRARHLTLSDWVTEASLIEREAKVADERSIIAGVIRNRLRRGMPLQMDASVEYLHGYARRLTPADLRQKSRFNTYLQLGLPPGPIASPGMSSLLAALHPKSVPYLYYVVRNDGSGRDYFAKTYAEHRRNIARSQANLRRVLQNTAGAHVGYQRQPSFSG